MTNELWFWQAIVSLEQFVIIGMVFWGSRAVYKAAWKIGWTTWPRATLKFQASAQPARFRVTVCQGEHVIHYWLCSDDGSERVMRVPLVHLEGALIKLECWAPEGMSTRTTWFRFPDALQTTLIFIVDAQIGGLKLGESDLETIETPILIVGPV